MSDVNLNFVVSNNDISFTVQPNDITFTPEVVDITITTAGIANYPAGASGDTQVTFNDNGSLGGNSNFTFNKTTSNVTLNGNLSVSKITSLGAVGNVRITGGTNGQIIKTDGAGNLSFISAVAGSNTQLQYNNAGNIGGIPTVTYNSSSGNLSLGAVSNVKITGGSSGQVIKTDGAGNLSFGTSVGGSTTQLQYNNAGDIAGIPTVTYASGNLNLGAVANVKVTGGTNGYILQTDGAGNLSWVSGGGTGNGTVGGSNTQVQYNNAGSFGGSTAFTFNNVTNTVAVTGTTSIQQAKEKVVISGSVPASTTTFDVLDGAINYYTGNMTTDITLNVRGNGSTSFNSITSVGDSVTIAMVTSSSATVYIISTFQIDGSTVVPKWPSNIPPSASLLSANGVNSYAYTIIKTGASAYTVLGSYTGYV